jgi:hypothetical protein
LCRICCSQSQTFCRLLAQHQNIQWAFKNIAPYSTQYASAVDELMKLMQLFVAKVGFVNKEKIDFFQGCGSGSGLDPDSVTLWIRIYIGTPDPDPGARKLRNFSIKMHILVI